MFSFLIALNLIFHPVHVSMTSIDVVPATDSMKVFVKIYYDDYLLDNSALRGIEHPQEKTVLSENILMAYLAAKIRIKIDNKELKGKLTNMVCNNNEVLINVLYKINPGATKLSIENQINTALYPDQTNMVILKINDIEEGFRLTPEQNEKSFELN